MDAEFEIVLVTDLFVVLVDLDNGGRSLTNDATAVVHFLEESLPGGIGLKTIYYRDSTGRFDIMRTSGGGFVGFAPCSRKQQETIAKMVDSKSCKKQPRCRNVR